MIFMKLTESHKAICCGDLSPRRVAATYRLVCPGLKSDFEKEPNWFRTSAENNIECHKNFNAVNYHMFWRDKNGPKYGSQEFKSHKVYVVRETGLVAVKLTKWMRKTQVAKFGPALAAIDLFADTAAILISVVSNSYYGMPRGQIHINLPPEHPIMSFETIEIKMAAVSAKRSIAGFHSRDQQPCFSTKTKGSVCIIIELNSRRIW